MNYLPTLIDDKKFHSIINEITKSVNNPDYFENRENWIYGDNNFKKNVLTVCNECVPSKFFWLKMNQKIDDINQDYVLPEHRDRYKTFLINLIKNLIYEYISDVYLYPYIGKEHTNISKLISTIQGRLLNIVNAFENYFIVWESQIQNDKLIIKCLNRPYYLWDIIENYFDTIKVDNNYNLHVDEFEFYADCYKRSQKHIVEILEKINDVDEKKNLINESYKNTKSAIYRNPNVKHPAESHYLIFLKDYIDNIDILEKNKNSKITEEPHSNHIPVYKTFKSKISIKSKTELYKLCNSILETDLNSFLKFLSGDYIKYPLKIKWLIRTKDRNNSSKPSLFYFLEQLSELRIIEERVFNDFKKIENIFVDFKGNKLKNLNGSTSYYGKKDPYHKESTLGKEIIDDIIFKIKKLL